MNKKGITLLELIVVMVIIAIGAVLMVPNIGSWLPHYRLRTAARDIVSTMRVAQMKAVASNVPYQVHFVDANDTYVLQRQSGGLFVDDGAVQSLPSEITFNGTVFPNDNAVFNPNSTASAGSIILTNPRGNQKTISVFSTTGRVRVQ